MSVFEFSKTIHVTAKFLREHVRGDLLCYTHPVPSPSLQDSIRDFGMTHPILLRQGYDQEPNIVISGHRRFWGAKNLPDHLTFPVIMIPRRSLSLKEALFLSLSENQTTRALNLIEKSNVLSLCGSILKMAETDMIEQVMPAIKLQPNRNQMQDLLKLRSLPKTVQNFIAESDIPLKTGKRLAQVSSTALDIFFPMMTGLKMGANRLDEILNHLDMIWHREEKTLEEVLEEILTHPVMGPILMAREIESTRKLEALRQHIRKRAFPMISGMEETFSQNLKRLSLPNHVSLQAPSFFEGDRMDVRLTFKTQSELKEAAEKLLNTADSAEIKTILSLL